MTRFCGDAVGVRAGRPKNFATGKERRRDMEARCGFSKLQGVLLLLVQCNHTLSASLNPSVPHQVFQRTGRHPDLERRPVSDALPSLPERDVNRQHVFFDLRQGKETLGAHSPTRCRSPCACVVISRVTLL